MFKLFRYFALTSLVAFVIVMGGVWQLSHQLVVLAMFALLYVILILLVRQADTIIHRQNTEHTRTEEVLRASRHQLEAIYQHEQERRQLSDILREVSRIVSSSLDQQQVVDLILAQLDQVITYHRATVALLKGNILTLVAGRDKMGGEIKPYSFIAKQIPAECRSVENQTADLSP